MALLGLGFKDSILAAARSLVKGFRANVSRGTRFWGSDPSMPCHVAPYGCRPNCSRALSGSSRPRSDPAAPSRNQVPGRLFHTLLVSLLGPGSMVASTGYLGALSQGRPSNPNIVPRATGPQVAIR